MHFPSKIHSWAHFWQYIRGGGGNIFKIFHAKADRWKLVVGMAYSKWRFFFFFLDSDLNTWELHDWQSGQWEMKCQRAASSLPFINFSECPRGMRSVIRDVYHAADELDAVWNRYIDIHLISVIECILSGILFSHVALNYSCWSGCWHVTNYI